MYPRSTLPERQAIGRATLQKDEEGIAEARRDFAAATICNHVVKYLGQSPLPLTPDQKAEIISLLDGHA
jgi:hypothetical protein